jgi:hypothetical protein
VSQGQIVIGIGVGIFACGLALLEQVLRGLKGARQIPPFEEAINGVPGDQASGIAPFAQFAGRFLADGPNASMARGRPRF